MALYRRTDVVNHLMVLKAFFDAAMEFYIACGGVSFEKITEGPVNQSAFIIKGYTNNTLYLHNNYNTDFNPLARGQQNREMLLDEFCSLLFYIHTSIVDISNLLNEDISTLLNLSSDDLINDEKGYFNSKGNYGTQNNTVIAFPYNEIYKAHFNAIFNPDSIITGIPSDWNDNHYTKVIIPAKNAALSARQKLDNTQLSVVAPTVTQNMNNSINKNTSFNSISSTSSEDSFIIPNPNNIPKGKAPMNQVQEEQIPTQKTIYTSTDNALNSAIPYTSDDYRRDFNAFHGAGRSNANANKNTLTAEDYLSPFRSSESNKPAQPSSPSTQTQQAYQRNTPVVNNNSNSNSNNNTNGTWNLVYGNNDSPQKNNSIDSLSTYNSQASSLRQTDSDRHNDNVSTTVNRVADRDVDNDFSDDVNASFANVPAPPNAKQSKSPVIVVFGDDDDYKDYVQNPSPFNPNTVTSFSSIVHVPTDIIGDNTAHAVLGEPVESPPVFSVFKEGEDHASCSFTYEAPTDHASSYAAAEAVITAELQLNGGTITLESPEGPVGETHEEREARRTLLVFAYLICLSYELDFNIPKNITSSEYLLFTHAMQLYDSNAFPATNPILWMHSKSTANYDKPEFKTYLEANVACVKNNSPVPAIPSQFFPVLRGRDKVTHVQNTMLNSLGNNKAGAADSSESTPRNITKFKIDRFRGGA